MQGNGDLPPWPYDALAITHVPSAQAARRLAEMPAITLTAPLYWDDLPTWDEEMMEPFVTLLAPHRQFVALKKRPSVDELWHVLVRFQLEDAYFAFSFHRLMHAHNMVLRPKTIRLVF